MPGYRGRRCHITDFIDKEPVEISYGRYGIRVKLECGHHSVIVSMSKNHRRSRPPKAAFCTFCPPREKSNG
jgi:hypothetical protein